MKEYHVYNAEGKLHSVEDSAYVAARWPYPRCECVYEVEDGVITGTLWIDDFGGYTINTEGEFIGRKIGEWRP